MLSLYFAARSTLGLRDPRLMLQIFALHLSISESYPVSVYGIVAVRDALEPLRNLVFNRPCRDDAFTVDQVIDRARLVLFPCNFSVAKNNTGCNSACEIFVVLILLYLVGSIH